LALRPARDELFDWILSNRQSCRYNLTSSGLGEPDLRAMGVDTSYEAYASEKADLEWAFAEDVAKSYKVDPENVVLTAGASEAIFLVYSAFGAGRRAVVPLPNYPPMFTVPRSLGMAVNGSLKGSRTSGTIIGLTDPNNPIGKSLNAGMVESLLDSSRGRKATVFVNETYREFAFPGEPRTHFGSSPDVVTCNTMTKFYGLGRLRVGWILADRKEARQLLYAKWAVSGHDSEYSLWLAGQVLRKRQRFVERARLIHSTNLGLMRKFLRDTDGVSADLGVTPFCLVRYSRGPSSLQLAKAILSRTGVLVAPGDFFGAPKAFRLCFTADEKELREGLRTLTDYFNS
jgi:aspartate/methionine/tyrosine aminotransferase